MTWLDIGNGWRNLFLLLRASGGGAGPLVLPAGLVPAPGIRWPAFSRALAATPCAVSVDAAAGAGGGPRPQGGSYRCAAGAGGGRPAGWGSSRLTRLRAFLRVGAPAHAMPHSGCGPLRMDRATAAAWLRLAWSFCLRRCACATCPAWRACAGATRANTWPWPNATVRTATWETSWKDDTTGHFRGHNHFPSLELYMSYGLFHTGGQVGYPNDKAVFTGLGLNTFYVAAAYLALLIVACQGAGAGCCWAWCCLTWCRICSPWKARPGTSGAFWRCGRCCFFAGLEPQGSLRSLSGQAGTELCRVLW